MEDDSVIEHLEHKLYARGDPPKLRPRRDFHEERHDDVRETWEEEDTRERNEEVARHPDQVLEALESGRIPGVPGAQVPAILRDERFKRSTNAQVRKQRILSRAARSIFITSFAFFLISASVAGYFLYFGNNQVTCDNIDIEVRGPMSIASGKELALDVLVTNRNTTPLQNADAVFDFPEGARGVNNNLLPAARQEIGTIVPGRTIHAISKVYLFGKEHEQQDVTIVLEYQIDNSNSRFSCSRHYAATIATAPIALTVEGLEEVTTGQAVTLKAMVRSNSEEQVSDQRVVVTYPYGFHVERTDPPASTNSNVWDIGDVSPGAEKTITIFGTASSQSPEMQYITVEVGEKDRMDNERIATILQMVEHPMNITRPFLALDLNVNDSTNAEVAIPIGDMFRGQLHWKNTLTYPIYDVSIEAAVPSTLMVAKTVDVPEGYFRSVDRTFLWDKQTDEKLTELEPGEDGSFSFSFATADIGNDAGVVNPTLDIAFTVHARRVSDNVPVSEQLVAQAKRTVKFISNLTLDPALLYSTGPFTNTGPYPPRADTATTFTVRWVLRNSSNDLANVEVRAALPVYVAWLDTTNTSEGTIAYNANTRQIIWQVGSIEPGAGYEKPDRVAQFQVRLVPSVTQVGEVIDLVLNPKVTGVDQFTGSMLEQSYHSQTSQLSGDPTYHGMDGQVVE